MLGNNGTSSSNRPAPISNKLDLDRYRYADKNGNRPGHSSVNQQKRQDQVGSSAGRKPISIDDDSDEESASSSSSSGSERPQKRRKFRRGKPPSEASSPIKPVEPAAKAPSIANGNKGKSVASQSPIVISDSGEDAAAKAAAGGSAGNVAPPHVRMARLFKPFIGVEECRKIYEEKEGNTREAMRALNQLKQQREREQGREGQERARPPSGAAMSQIAKFQGDRGAKQSSERPSTSQAPARTAAPAQDRSGRPARPKHSDDDSDGGSSRGGWSGSEDSDREYARRARGAVRWFNDASEETLMETVGCTAAQAKIIADLRPFASGDDAEEKLRARKGVTGKLFTDYIEILAAFQVVDKVLQKCEKRAEKLEKATTPEAVAADKHYLREKPRGMAADFELKDYQLEGVNWLALRYRMDTSCILADDMGTGKTCQVIAFLCSLKARGIEGPNLIVVPSSTLENWSRELKRFGPSLHYVVYAGSQDERRALRYELLEDRAGVDVILSSYNSATSKQDDPFFRKLGFNACVYDEGHQLKNQNTKIYASLMRVKANWRLLLTGTPLQNNLLELMSLLNFIMPRDFKHASEAVETIFKAKGGAGRDSQLSKSRVDRAKRMMGPFVLRRLKDAVLQLPPKTLRVEYCDMTATQAKVYKKVLARTRLELLEQDDTGGKAKKDKSSNILMRLRKAAIHPMLFRTIFTADKIKALARDYVKDDRNTNYDFQELLEDFAINSDAELSQLAGNYAVTTKHQVPGESWLNSGKIVALRRLIEDIRSRGEKLVIFSQFEMVLFVLMSALEEMKVQWIAFSGRTAVDERQDVIDRFQTDPDITVFLLTTKAGGVGVNLTAANWVIMMDQDVSVRGNTMDWTVLIFSLCAYQFNPQNDKQAEDRCWRIGQTKEVTVIKLISKGTIDEDILALGLQKLELAARVSGMEQGRGSRAGSVATSTSAAATPPPPAAAPASSSIMAKTASNSVDTSGAGTPTTLKGSEIGPDDEKEQEKAAQSLMSKLRSRVAGAGAGEQEQSDADDGDDIEIL